MTETVSPLWDKGFKQINHVWAFVDPLTVKQAAALFVGFNPNAVDVSGDYFKDVETGFTDSDGITLVQTALAALVNAINAGKLKATVRYSAREYGYADQIADIEYNEVLCETGYGRTAEDDETLASDHSCFYKPFPDWNLTLVNRTDLTAWMESKGIRTGFFFPTATEAPDYLDPKNPRYAPKLAAAVRAWQSVTDPCGKHPQASADEVVTGACGRILHDR